MSPEERRAAQLSSGKLTYIAIAITIAIVLGAIELVRIGDNVAGQDAVLALQNEAIEQNRLTLCAGARVIKANSRSFDRGVTETAAEYRERIDAYKDFIALSLTIDCNLVLERAQRRHGRTRAARGATALITTEQGTVVVLPPMRERPPPEPEEPMPDGPAAPPSPSDAPRALDICVEILIVPERCVEVE